MTKVPKGLVARFWAKVKRLPGEDACWLWTACLNGEYGQITREGTTKVYAHRLLWEIANGPVPDGVKVLHHCDNPPCVRPSHLFLGTSLDNNRDMVAKGRERPWGRLATECKNGHAFDQANTYVEPDGTRQCRHCRRDKEAARRARRRAA